MVLGAATLSLAFGTFEAARWAGKASDFNGLADPTSGKALCGAGDANRGADARCQPLYDSMSTARTLTIGGLGAGVALGVVTAVLFRRAGHATANETEHAGAGPTISLSCGPSVGSRMGLACAARF